MTIHVGRSALVVVGAIAVLAMLAVAAGWIPLYQLWWLGLVLVCPVMMFLMMQGMHGGHGDSSEHRDEQSQFHRDHTASG